MKYLYIEYMYSKICILCTEKTILTPDNTIKPKAITKLEN